jgi:hypothetical protein
LQSGDFEIGIARAVDESEKPLYQIVPLARGQLDGRDGGCDLSSEIASPLVG